MIWTFFFIIFGIFTTHKIEVFTDKYLDKIEVINTYIEEDDWENAKIYMQNYHTLWHSEKTHWYKLLNHDYLDGVCLQLELLLKNISTEDKSKALEKIEAIKSNLENILELEKCDLNHIF
jgi:hypothetical protein